MQPCFVGEARDAFNVETLPGWDSDEAEDDPEPKTLDTLCKLMYHQCGTSKEAMNSWSSSRPCGLTRSNPAGNNHVEGNPGPIPIVNFKKKKTGTFTCWCFGPKGPSRRGRPPPSTSTTGSGGRATENTEARGSNRPPAGVSGAGVGGGAAVGFPSSCSTCTRKASIALAGLKQNKKRPLELNPCPCQMLCNNNASWVKF